MVFGSSEINLPFIMELKIPGILFAISKPIFVKEFRSTIFVCLSLISLLPGNLRFALCLSLPIMFFCNLLYSIPVHGLPRLVPVHRPLHWGPWLGSSGTPLGDCVMGFGAGANSGFCSLIN